jgi:hypothetical protein
LLLKNALLTNILICRRFLPQVLPQEWQIPFISSASLIWTIVLSSIGSSSQPQIAPSTIVTYEPVGDGLVDKDGIEFVTVVPVEAGAANDLTDEVLLQDVENALLPDKVSEVVGKVWNDGRVGAGAGGLAIGLLASAADDGAIGAAIGSLVGGDEVGVGVAVISAVSAGVGLLAASGGDKDEAIEKEVDMDADIDVYNQTFTPDEEESSSPQEAMTHATRDNERTVQYQTSNARAERLVTVSNEKKTL